MKTKGATHEIGFRAAGHGQKEEAQKRIAVKHFCRQRRI